jgi:hypothetical protein
MDWFERLRTVCEQPFSLILCVPKVDDVKIQ